MGRVKQLWQDECDARWQQHYDDYVLENFGGRDVEGVANDEACDYADDMLQEEETAPAVSAKQDELRQSLASGGL